MQLKERGSNEETRERYSALSIFDWQHLVTYSCATSPFRVLHDFLTPQKNKKYKNKIPNKAFSVYFFSDAHDTLNSVAALVRM